METARTYVVPAAFWYDHCERACRCSDRCPDQEAHDADYGTPVKGGIQIDLTDIDLVELLSDASYYASDGKYMSVSIGLISSARATVKRLQEVGVS